MTSLEEQESASELSIRSKDEEGSPRSDDSVKPRKKDKKPKLNPKLQVFLSEMENSFSKIS